MSSCTVTLQEWEQLRAADCSLPLEQLRPYPDSFSVSRGQVLATQHLLNATLLQLLGTVDDEDVDSDHIFDRVCTQLRVSGASSRHALRQHYDSWHLLVEKKSAATAAGFTQQQAEQVRREAAAAVAAEQQQQQVPAPPAAAGVHQPRQSCSVQGPQPMAPAAEQAAQQQAGQQHSSGVRASTTESQGQQQQLERQFDSTARPSAAAAQAATAPGRKGRQVAVKQASLDALKKGKRCLDQCKDANGEDFYMPASALLQTRCAVGFGQQRQTATAAAMRSRTSLAVCSQRMRGMVGHYWLPT